MTIDRRGLEIGPFDLFGITINPTFHFYGLIIVLGIGLAAFVAAWMAQRDKKDPEHVWNGLLWLLILGVIGARLWHVLFPSESSVEAGRDTAWYLSHPFDLHDGPLVIWSGGLGIFGAVIGGALGIWLYGRRHQLDILSWVDIGAVVVPLGQAVGRWGNFVNEELYGTTTDLPWGLKLDNPPAGYSSADRFHPLFLYESLWNLLNFGVLLAIWLRFRDRLKKGDFLLIYLVLYGLTRFALEFLRFEPTTMGAINISRTFTAGMVLVGLTLLALRHWDTLSGRGRSSGARRRKHQRGKNQGGKDRRSKRSSST